MIKKFKQRGLKRLYEKGDGSKLLKEHLERIEDILGHLDTATTVQAMDLPGYNLHPLKGNLKEFWSVTVRANWRIIFRFDDGDAYDVNYEDYH